MKPKKTGIKVYNKVEVMIILGLLIIQVSIPLAASDTAISYDGNQYLQYAHNITNLGWYTYDGINPSCGRAPGYPFLLAVLIWMFGSIEPLYFLQLILLFIAYYLIVRPYREHLGNRWSIVLLAVFVALWPLNRVALVAMSESLFICLSSVGLFFLYRFLQTKAWISLFIFSAATTLSAYVRPVTTLFVFFAVIALLLFRRIKWEHALVAATLSAAILAPWTFRNWKEFGRVIPMASTYGSVYYMTDQEEFKNILLHSAGSSHNRPAYLRCVGDDFELDPPANDRFLELAKKNIRDDPLGFFKRCVLKTVFVWSYLPGTKKFLHSYPLLFYAGVAIQLLFLITASTGALMLIRRRSALAWAPILFAVYHVFFLFPFYAESRYLVPSYIWLLGLSAIAVFSLARRLRGVTGSRQ